MKNKAIVIGAGIQGILAALNLVKKGYHVTILEKSSTALNRASRVNEGKIHLGLIWANDPSFETAAYMLRSSMLFAPLVDDIVGRRLNWSKWLSKPFDYVCMHDSMLTPDKLQSFYEKLEEEYHANYYGSEYHYLGMKPQWLSKEHDTIDSYLHQDQVQRVWKTNEFSMDVREFNRELLEVAQSSDQIHFHFDHKVVGIDKRSFGYQVECTSPTGILSYESSIVVNCSWEGRLKLDEEVGHKARHSWSYRLKHAVHGKLHHSLAEIPSMTFVLGPYGDVVNFGTAQSAYMSWYPAGMKHTSDLIEPPIEWEAICNGETNASSNRIRENILKEFGSVIKNIDLASDSHESAGIIYSLGSEVIADPDSEVHKRFQVGIMHHKDGYISIDTGKYTCAPLHSQELMKFV